MKKIYNLVICFIAMCQFAMSQEIKGKITDAITHKPLFGASLKNGNGRSIAKSNEKGLFDIKGNGISKLYVSSVGYRDTTISITSDKTFYEIVLMPVQKQLEEVTVVHTGYQDLAPAQMTGAVQALGETALNKQAGRSILDRINNLVPGLRLDPNVRFSDQQKTNVRIRGLSTINGQLDPLIVLDGFIYEGSLDNIDPNNVENVTVLKDAAASSIWGARAGNGVIVITTKRGKFNRSFSVAFNSAITVSSKPDLYKIFQMPSADYIAFEKLVFEKGYYDNRLNISPYYANSPAVKIFQQLKKGNISESDAQIELERLGNIDARKDYSKYLMRTPLMGQSSISLDGGTERHAFNYSGSYTSDMNAQYAGYKKWNFNVFERVKISDKLDMDFRLNYTNSNNKAGRPGYRDLTVVNRFYPYYELVDSDGNPRYFEDIYDKDYVDQFYPGQLLSWDYVPLEDYKHVRNTTRTEELYAVANASYRILPSLGVKIGYQIQQQKVGHEVLYDGESRLARTEYNRFAAYDPATDRMTFPVPAGGIRELSNAQNRSYTLRGQLDFKKELAGHALAILLGGEIRENTTTAEAYKAYGYSEDPLVSIPVDYVGTYPIAVLNGSSNISGAPAFESTINRFVSLYGNLLYTWKDRYGLSSSVRQDGANIFGASSNDKWKPLWSVGSFWNVSNERFLKNVEWINALKLRMTYGVSGNVDLRKTPLPLANVTSNTNSNFPVLVIGSLNDPSLRWEKVEMFNLGADFSILKGRLAGSFDIYRKHGRDLYGLTGYDYTVWGAQPFITKNVASMEGKGIDLMLTSKNIVGPLNWQTTLVLSQNKNKTKTYYSLNPVNEADFLSSGNTITPVPGLPLYAIAGFKWGGLDQNGNPQSYVNGMLSNDYSAINKEGRQLGVNGNIIFKGSAKPQLFGSIENSFGYKNLTLSVSIAFQGDYYFRKNTTSYGTFLTNGIAYSDIMERWQQAGDELKTNVPSFAYPVKSQRDLIYRQADINILRADHARLAYINLSWSPKLKLGQSFTQTSFYFNARNLGIIWTANKEHIDPEYQDEIAPLKTFTLGLRVNFK